VQWLGRARAYDEVAAQMAALVDMRRRDLVPDTLLLLEHAPVVTLGRDATPDDLLAPAEALEVRGVAVRFVDRGGRATYHGPGQLVGYPVVKLSSPPLRALVPFIEAIEQLLIDTAAAYGVAARRVPRNRGVWVGGSKLAALGIHLSGGVTSHGFALNVDTDLRAYDDIVPCGLRDAGVTSLAAELGPSAPAFDEVVATLVRAL